MNRFESFLLAILYIAAFIEIFYGLIVGILTMFLLGLLSLEIGILIDIKFDNLIGKFKG